MRWLLREKPTGPMPMKAPKGLTNAGAPFGRRRPTSSAQPPPPEAAEATEEADADTDGGAGAPVQRGRRAGRVGRRRDGSCLGQRHRSHFSIARTPSAVHRPGGRVVCRWCSLFHGRKDSARWKQNISYIYIIKRAVLRYMRRYHGEYLKRYRAFLASTARLTPEEVERLNRASTLYCRSQTLTFYLFLLPRCFFKIQRQAKAGQGTPSAA